MEGGREGRKDGGREGGREGGWTEGGRKDGGREGGPYLKVTYNRNGLKRFKKVDNIDNAHAKQSSAKRRHDRQWFEHPCVLQWPPSSCNITLINGFGLGYYHQT